MLQVFRDNLRSLAPVLWIVIIAFVAIEFSVFGRNLGGPGAADAASVGGHNVTMNEFQNNYRQLESQYRQTFGENFTPELAQQFGLHQQALDRAINRKILIAEADRMGLAATEEEVREVILNDPSFLDDTGNFVGEEQYRKTLTRMRMSPDQFESSVREQLLDFKLQSVLADTVFVSDQEVEEKARSEAEKANIRYVQLTGASLASEVEVSEAEIAAQFEKNPDQYRLPEQRRAGYLSIPINVIRAELEIPDSDLQAYYDANQDEFRQEEQVRARQILLFADGAERDEAATRALAEDIKRRIEAGEDFAALASEYSEDQVSKARGGDLGFFTRGSYTPAFEDAVFAAQPGLVGPIDNTLGTRKVLHIVEVLQKREGGVQPFEEVKNTIRVRELNDRAREVADERASALSTRLETETPGTEEELRALAAEEGIVFELLEPFSLDDNLAGIGRRTELAQQIFDLDPGVYGTATRIPAGWGIPVTLEVLEPRLPELAEVQDRVRQDVVTRKQGELAVERLTASAEALRNGEKTLDEIAADLSLTATESGLFGETGSISGLGVQPEVNQAALALDQGGIGGPITTNTGAVLFEVTERQRFDPLAFVTQKEAQRNQIALERLNQMLSALVSKRRQEYKIQYSAQVEQILEQAANPDAGAGG